jgi:DNA repair photolyase
VRWETLSAKESGAAAARAVPPLPLALPGAVTRTFDTPGFAGMTFYEIRAKSISNKVPAASRVPFEWTVNPYRGCAHACVYCLAGDTPILMADGRTRPLGDLRAGDEVCGTELIGADRRLTTTRVLAHWMTVKPAHRLRLADGAALVASGDHRFLTDQGWRYVTGLAPGTPLVTPDGRVAVASVEPLHEAWPMFDIMTGTGDFVASGAVSHNCFARNTHTYLDLDAGRDFDTRVIVKVNAGALLRRELAAPRWSGAHIAMGTNVDCYQRAEGRYRLMRDILAALRDFANPFSILTKGTLILRDLDLLRQAAQVTDVSLSMSVGFVDEALWRAVEPGTPAPRRRLDAVRQLTDAGFAVGVLVAPILPGLSDDDESIEATVAAIAAAGACSATPIPLHLRPGAREWYLSWLGRYRPDLVARYRALFRGGSYSPKDYQRDVCDRVREAARRHRIGAGEPGAARRVEPPPPPPEPEQLTLL